MSETTLNIEPEIALQKAGVKTDTSKSVDFEAKYKDKPSYHLFTEYKQLVSVKQMIEEKNKSINNNKELAKLRTNFLQRIGSQLVDDLLFQKEWTQNGNLPSESQIDDISNQYGDRIKEIVNSAEIIDDVDNSKFVKIKRINTMEIDADGNDDHYHTQYSTLPYHNRLVKIFFEEFQNSKHYKSKEKNSNKLIEIDNEMEYLDSVLFKNEAPNG